MSDQLPRQQDPRKPKSSALRPYDEEEMKELVQGAMYTAMQTFVSTLTDPEAKPSERLRAAEVIINYGTGAKASPFASINKELPVVDQLAQLLDKVRNPDA